MPDLVSPIVAFAWAHPLALIGGLLCAVLYVRLMMSGPRES